MSFVADNMDANSDMFSDNHDNHSVISSLPAKKNKYIYNINDIQLIDARIKKLSQKKKPKNLIVGLPKNYDKNNCDEIRNIVMRIAKKRYIKDCKFYYIRNIDDVINFNEFTFIQFDCRPFRNELTQQTPLYYIRFKSSKNMEACLWDLDSNFNVVVPARINVNNNSINSISSYPNSPAKINGTHDSVSLNGDYIDSNSNNTHLKPHDISFQSPVQSHVNSLNNGHNVHSNNNNDYFGQPNGNKHYYYNDNTVLEPHHNNMDYKNDDIILKPNININNYNKYGSKLINNEECRIKSGDNKQIKAKISQNYIIGVQPIKIADPEPQHEYQQNLKGNDMKPQIIQQNINPNVHHNKIHSNNIQQSMEPIIQEPNIMPNNNIKNIKHQKNNNVNHNIPLNKQNEIKLFENVLKKCQNMMSNMNNENARLQDNIISLKQELNKEKHERKKMQKQLHESNETFKNEIERLKSEIFQLKQINHTKSLDMQKKLKSKLDMYK